MYLFKIKKNKKRKEKKGDREAISSKMPGAVGLSEANSRRSYLEQEMEVLRQRHRLAPEPVGGGHGR